MEKIILKRDGFPPIVFIGEEIGSGSTAWNGGRKTHITLHRTARGRYVATVERLTQWERERDHTEAEAFDTVPEVIAWLKGDYSDTLGSASQEAVEEAAKNDPAFAAAWIETVE